VSAHGHTSPSRGQPARHSPHFARFTTPPHTPGALLPRAESRRPRSAGAAHCRKGRGDEGGEHRVVTYGVCELSSMCAHWAWQCLWCAPFKRPLCLLVCEHNIACSDETEGSRARSSEWRRQQAGQTSWWQLKIVVIDTLPGVVHYALTWSPTPNHPRDRDCAVRTTVLGARTQWPARGSAGLPVCGSVR
jgi:hypothetical protein